MMLVIAYDVDTTSSAGSQRLRKVARLCERHGIRVQNSVFEVLLDPAQLVALKAGLEKIICKETVPSASIAYGTAIETESR